MTTHDPIIAGAASAAIQEHKPPRVQDLFYEWRRQRAEAAVCTDDQCDAIYDELSTLEPRFATVAATIAYEIDMKVQVLADMFENGGVDDSIWMPLVASIRADLRSLGKGVSL